MRGNLPKHHEPDSLAPIVMTMRVALISTNDPEMSSR